MSSRRHLASFICIYKGQGWLSPHCYMWLPACLLTEYVLSTGWNAACRWFNYSKPPTCPKVETDHSSRAGHFIKSMLSLFMFVSKRHKWPTCDAEISSINSKWTWYSLVCCVTHHPFSFTQSLSVYTFPSFSLLPHFSRSLIFRWQAHWIFDHTAWKNSTESCCKASLSLTLIPSHHISISSELKHI